ncbi:MAG: hypothetical protein JWN17_2869, partial [Frankiales bacterium]|nr:hypothetical protein [Frankiales bacterium]
GTGPSAGAAPAGTTPVAAGAVAAAADDFALTFKAFGPKLGLPKLPPLPATGVALPDVAPLADGSFGSQLPFGQKEVSEKVPLASGPVGRVRQVVTSAVDAERLARSIAAALVLLLAGAHLRRWLGQAPADS